MAQTSNAVRLTPLASLIDHALGGRGGTGLGTYLALSRMPGAKWKTYDEIAEHLSDLIDRRLNRVSIQTFAEVMFGLPSTRYVEVDGRNIDMPEAVGAEQICPYLEYVREHCPNVIDNSALLTQADEYVADYLRTKGEAEQRRGELPRRLAGHSLPNEGRVHDGHGQGYTNGPGRVQCSCGEHSPELPNTAQRRKWHRQHKADVLAAMYKPAHPLDDQDAEAPVQRGDTAGEG